LDLKILLFFIINISSASLFSQESNEHLNSGVDVYKIKPRFQIAGANWQKSMRSKALESIDKILSWTFDQSQYPYCLKSPLQEEIFHNEDQKIISFDKEFGYFSQGHPLVGKVTSAHEDIEITLNMLETIHERVTQTHQRNLMTAEVLTKVLAYRDLKKGQVVAFSTGASFIRFEVDILFDLGDGMPAFGLIPKERKNAAPVLLFRGTDISLLSQRGLASLISDFDPKGPGLTAFKRAQPAIHRWLEKVAREGHRARVMGFSLGGALAAYTVLFEHELINPSVEEASFAFNPPGVTKKIFNLWKKLSAEQRPPLNLFVAKGDLISKIGRLFGDLYELSTSALFYPIAAHVTLMTAQPCFYQNGIDLSMENCATRFSR
jgi:hypothetical protein